MKKIITSIIVLLAILVLTGCEPPAGSQHKVSFLKNEEVIKTINVGHNRRISISEVPVVVADPGTRFIGWYNGDEVFDINETQVTVDLSLKAGFTGETPEPKPGEVAVKFYGKDDELIKTINVVKGEKLTSTSFTPTAPSGYLFNGWYTSSARTTKYNLDTAINETLSLYAKFDIVGGGDYGNYYNTILDTDRGDTLKNKLYDIIKTGKTGSYSSGKSRPVLADADSVDGSRVYLIYDGKYATASAAHPAWNQEHVWPKSLHNSSNAGDIHNLRASTVSVNSTRGNMKFAEGSGGWKTVSGGFYPGDDHKGDVARICLYAIVRYPNLSITKVFPSMAVALKWHAEDPVDAFEIYRNDVIAKAQGNRNPFIDHPEFAERIWGQSNTSYADYANETFDFMELAFNYRDTIQYGVDISSKENGGLILDI